MKDTTPKDVRALPKEVTEFLRSIGAKGGSNAAKRLGPKKTRARAIKASKAAVKARAERKAAAAKPLTKTAKG